MDGASSRPTSSAGRQPGTATAAASRATARRAITLDRANSGSYQEQAAAERQRQHDHERPGASRSLEASPTIVLSISACSRSRRSAAASRSDPAGATPGAWPRRRPRPGPRSAGRALRGSAGCQKRATLKNTAAGGEPGRPQDERHEEPAAGRAGGEARRRRRRARPGRAGATSRSGPKATGRAGGMGPTRPRLGKLWPPASRSMPVVVEGQVEHRVDRAAADERPAGRPGSHRQPGPTRTTRRAGRGRPRTGGRAVGRGTSADRRGPRGRGPGRPGRPRASSR